MPLPPKTEELSRIHLWNLDLHNLDKKSIPMLELTFQIHLWNLDLCNRTFSPD